MSFIMWILGIIIAIAFIGLLIRFVVGFTTFVLSARVIYVLVLIALAVALFFILKGLLL